MYKINYILTSTNTPAGIETLDNTCSVSAVTLSAGTIYSGSTNLSTIINNIASGYTFGSGTGSTGQYLEIYTATTTWTAPVGVYSVVIELWGAGGGGGAGQILASTSLAGGGAGASGSYVFGEVPVVPGTTYIISVGSGGTPGYYTNTNPPVSFQGTQGGSSIFGSLVAYGGKVGSNATTLLNGTGGTSPYYGNVVGPINDIIYTPELFFVRGIDGTDAKGVPATSSSAGGWGGDTIMFGRALFNQGSTAGETPTVAVNQVGYSAPYFGAGGGGGTGGFSNGFGANTGYSGGTGSGGLAILRWNAGSGTTFQYNNTFSGGTISGNTNVTANLSANTFYSGSTLLDSLFARTNHVHNQYATLSGATFSGPVSASTLSAQTLYSGSTNLYSIFLTTADVSATTISAGSNISVSNVGLNYTVRTVDSPSFNNGSFSGSLSANTFVSGSTNINSLFADKIHTHSQYATLSGATFTAPISATTISANTFVSGSTLLDSLFARTNHVHNQYATLSGSNFTGAISATTIFSGSSNINSLFAPRTVTNYPWELGLAISDETTAMTTGTSKLAFFIPFDCTLTGTTLTLSTTGSTTTGVDIKKSGTTIYSTKAYINPSGKTSLNATTQYVITASTVSAWNEFTVDILSASTGSKGLKIWLTGYRTTNLS